MSAYTSARKRLMKQFHFWRRTFNKSQANSMMIPFVINGRIHELIINELKLRNVLIIIIWLFRLIRSVQHPFTPSFSVIWSPLTSIFQIPCILFVSVEGVVLSSSPLCWQTERVNNPLIFSSPLLIKNPYGNLRMYWRVCSGLTSSLQSLAKSLHHQGYQFDYTFISMDLLYYRVFSFIV